MVSLNTAVMSTFDIDAFPLMMRVLDTKISLNFQQYVRKEKFPQQSVAAVFEQLTVTCMSV